MLPKSTFRFATITLSVLVAVLLATTANAQATIKLIGHLDPFDGDNRYGDVWGEGNYAYLGSYNGNGVMIIDISNPATPRMVGHYNPAEGGRFQDVMVINGVGYFSSENRGGLHIVDVSNPANPTLLSQISQEQNGFPNVHELFVADGVLYEADSRTNIIKVFDVRDPRNPRFVRDIQTTDTRFIHAPIAVNGRLFTSGWSGKTDIYDVSNVLNAAPALLGSIDSGPNSHASWPGNDGKLLASARETANGDVRLFDISNPANPVLLSAISAQSLGLDAFTAHNPYIIGNLLFVSWYQAGLVIIDISNPHQPRLVSTYDTFPGSVNGFDGCWGVYPFLGFDRVLLSDLDGGLFIVDTTAAMAGPSTVSAASYSFSAIADKSIVSAFGINLAASTLAANISPLPLSLGGSMISVTDFKGVERFAPLFFISPNQINYQIPADTAPGPALVKFTNGNGLTVNGAVIIAQSAISIFTLDASGRGAAAALDAFTFTGGPFNASRSDGQPNIIAVFCTGLGKDGTDIDANLAASVEATIDGQPVTITYAGRAPGFTGLNQLNIVFPMGITPGEHKLAAMRNGVISNTVSIAVK
ncbi:MAG: choice-of-anchor B family protein [Blastocatellales bacterium]